MRSEFTCFLLPEAFLERGLGGSLMRLRAKYEPYEVEGPNRCPLSNE